MAGKSFPQVGENAGPTIFQSAKIAGVADRASSAGNNRRTFPLAVASPIKRICQTNQYWMLAVFADGEH